MVRVKVRVRVSLLVCALQPLKSLRDKYDEMFSSITSWIVL